MSAGARSNESLTMMTDQSANLRHRGGKPCERMRGSWITDYNNSLTLIRAPIDDVLDALADRTERWERDVLGRDIVVTGLDYATQ